MSDLRANTISNLAGTGPATLTGQSAAKAWHNYNANPSATLGSYNVSSLTDDGVGQHTTSFTNSFSSSDDQCPSVVSAAAGSSIVNSATGVRSKAAGSFQLWTELANGNDFDANPTCASVSGDLA